MSCDSTSVAETRQDDRCFNMLMFKETMPGAIHSDQMADLKTACTVTVYNCYINQ
jgi:hypothetical protein